MHLVHQHALIKISNHELVTEEVKLNSWLETLTTDILKMKICLPARSIYIEQEGNNGLTGQVGLVTSHISIHCFDDYNFSQLDVYSCSEYNLEDVIEYIKNTLKPEKVQVLSVDRQDESIYNLVS